VGQETPAIGNLALIKNEKAGEHWVGVCGGPKNGVSGLLVREWPLKKVLGGGVGGHFIRGGGSRHDRRDWEQRIKRMMVSP